MSNGDTDAHIKAKQFMAQVGCQRSDSMTQIESGKFNDGIKAIAIRAPSERFAVVIENSRFIDKLMITNPGDFQGKVSSSSCNPKLRFVMVTNATPGDEYVIHLTRSTYVNKGEESSATMTLIAMSFVINSYAELLKYI